MITTGFGFGALKRSLRNPTLHWHRCLEQFYRQVPVTGPIPWQLDLQFDVGPRYFAATHQTALYDDLGLGA
jgi:hypothetical protein